MPTKLHREKLLGRRRIFLLQGATLTVDATNGRQSTSTTFALEQVALPSIRITAVNSHSLNRGFTYLAIVLVLSAIARAVAPTQSLWIWLSTLLLAAPGFYIVLYYILPLKIVQYRDANGSVLFDFVERRRTRRDLQEFLTELDRLINVAQPESPAPIPRQRP